MYLKSIPWHPCSSLKLGGSALTLGRRLCGRKAGLPEIINGLLRQTDSGLHVCHDRVKVICEGVMPL